MKLLNGLSVVAMGLSAAFLSPSAASSQDMESVPARAPGEGEGPFPVLVIRGATMIQGNGSPPRGPVDIVVKGNRIAEILPAGTPGLKLEPNREPRTFDREIDATGMFILPGFVDMHGHNGDPAKAPSASHILCMGAA